MVLQSDPSDDNKYRYQIEGNLKTYDFPGNVDQIVERHSSRQLGASRYHRPSVYVTFQITPLRTTAEEVICVATSEERFSRWNTVLSTLPFIWACRYIFGLLDLCNVKTTSSPSDGARSWNVLSRSGKRGLARHSDTVACLKGGNVHVLISSLIPRSCHCVIEGSQWNTMFRTHVPQKSGYELSLPFLLSLCFAWAPRQMNFSTCSSQSGNLMRG